MLKGVVGCGWVRCLGCGFAPVGLNGFAPVGLNGFTPVFFFLNGFAPVFFFEWVSFGGFQIGWVSNRRREFLIGGFVGLMAWV